MNPSDKIYSSLESLATACAAIRASGQTLVLTSGCFDILHQDHGRYVYAASLLGHLIVGINSDAFVRRLKGPNRPHRPEDDRAYTMACFEAASGVTVFDDDLELIEAVTPHIYVVSGTSHVLIEDDPLRLALIERLGIKVTQIASNNTTSTTAILSKL